MCRGSTPLIVITGQGHDPLFLSWIAHPCRVDEKFRETEFWRSCEKKISSNKLELAFQYLLSEKT